MTIDLKIDISSLRKEIAAEILKQDALAEKAANQLLIEGKNVAKANVLKDTHDLERSIDSDSYVKRLSPCVFEISLGSNMEYAEYQEFGPKSETKKKWRFRPFIRPAVFIMESKFDEVTDRVWGD
jgi:hypothetical protein